MTALAIGLVAAGLLGLALLVAGLRGRRIDDHAVCARCRFDLTGGVGSVPERCPECGGELDDAKSVRTGNRRRRRWAVGWGGALIAVVLLAGGGLAWVGLSGFNWAPHAPSGVLIWHARAASVENAPPSLVELRARAADGELSERQVDRVIEDALALQAAGSRPWKVEYGNFLAWAGQTGALSASQAQRFAEGAFEFELNVPERVRIGSPLEPRASLRIDRGPDRGPMLHVAMTMEDIGIVDHEGPGPVRLGGMSGSIRTRNGSLGLSGRYGDLPADLPVGSEQRVEAVVRFEFLGFGQRAAEPLAAFERRLEAPFVVAGADATLVETTTDPSLEAQVRDAVAVERPTLRRQGAGRALSAVVRRDGLPIAVSADVEIVQNGETVGRGRILLAPAEFEASQTAWFEADDLRLGPATLLFRPNPKWAERSPGVDRIWGGTLRIEIDVEAPAGESGDDAADSPSDGD